MSPGPAPTLVTDWFTWAFVLTAIAVFALVVLTVEILKARETLSQERLDALTDEHVQGQVDRYHCAGHGHYYGAHPEVFVDCDVWTCKTCGHEAPVMHGGRKPFDQASA